MGRCDTGVAARCCPAGQYVELLQHKGSVAPCRRVQATDVSIASLYCWKYKTEQAALCPQSVAAVHSIAHQSLSSVDQAVEKCRLANVRPPYQCYLCMCAKNFQHVPSLLAGSSSSSSSDAQDSQKELNGHLVDLLELAVCGSFY